jgi:hypothetical protein
MVLSFEAVKTCKFDIRKKQRNMRRQHNTKLAINGTFADVIKLLVQAMPKKEDKAKDKPKKK